MTVAAFAQGSILKQTLDYLKTGSDAIDPKTDETYQFYKGLIESRKAGSA